MPLAYIFLVMAGVIKASGQTDKAHRAEAGQFHVMVDRAVLLGAKYVRVFLGRPPTVIGTRRSQSRFKCSRLWFSTPRPEASRS